MAVARLGEAGLELALRVDVALSSVLQELARERRSCTAALAELFEHPFERLDGCQAHGEGIVEGPFRLSRRENGHEVEDRARHGRDPDPVNLGDVAFWKQTRLTPAGR